LSIALRMLPLAQGVPKLVIGKSRMFGKWVKLKKPIAVMAQQPRATDSADREYHAAGIVRHKLVFSDRPDPIITAIVKPTSKRARAMAPKPVAESDQAVTAPVAESGQAAAVAS
jgi:hypothetical protein